MCLVLIQTKNQTTDGMTEKKLNYITEKKTYQTKIIYDKYPRVIKYQFFGDFFSPKLNYVKLAIQIVSFLLILLIYLLNNYFDLFKCV